MSTYDSNADVQDDMAGHLVALVRDAVGQRPGAVLEIGCGTGLLTRRLVRDMRPDRLWLNDLCPASEDFIRDIPVDDKVFVSGDAENIDFPERLDMIVSSAAVQWFDDLESFFSKCYRALASGGVLAFSTFGKDNLKEVSVIEGVGLDYYDRDRLVLMLGDRFEVIVAEEACVRLTFSSPLDVIRHLKETGVTGLGKEKWTKGRLLAFSHEYEERYGCGNSVPLTYNPVWIIAKKRF